MKYEDKNTLRKEFDRQVENLLQKGYPELASVRTEDFLKDVEPLRACLTKLSPAEKDTQPGHIPFVIVLQNDFVSAEIAMPLIEVKNKSGYVDMRPLDSKSFAPIESLDIPGGMAYLMVGVKTGQDTLNVTPHNALKQFQSQNRSPLLIEEGVALVTHFPEVLTDKKHYNCFSLPGSRREDQRVPAIWISYSKPRLGWCWDNNPHTWLGSASCARRLGT